MNPHHIFAFGIAVAMPLLLLLLVHPAEGLHVYGDFKLEFPTFRSTFYPAQDTTSIDTLAFPDEDPLERERKLDSIRALRYQIHYPNNDPSLFNDLFASLEALGPGKKSLHVLHFGGSQIEGDRITEHLRAELQARFSGNGPGWLPAVPFVGSRTVLIEHSENWKRYAMYGLVDSTVQHNHYGAMGLYARLPEEYDSTRIDTSLRQGWLHYKTRGSADQKARSFSRFTLFYGYNKYPVTLRLVGGEQTIHETILQPSEKTQVFQHSLGVMRRDLRLEFSGIESPEIYGVSLEGSSGIMVSNISLRGQAGTHFWTQPSQQMRAMFGSTNVRLIILQFGANAVPYSKNEAAIQEYSERFGKNIAYLRKLSPAASVIVIGPADMAKKSGTEWTTYPMLTQLRDAMKQTAFNAGAAYWDPYEAMGGAGTIQQWVLSDPPLAVNDHVHFTIEGAEKIAQWFYEAFIKDYDNYLSSKAAGGQ